jgi:hypothetical protein
MNNNNRGQGAHPLDGHRSDASRPSNRFSLFELNSSGSSPMSTAHIIDLMSDYNNNIRDMLRMLERADDGRLETIIENMTSRARPSFSPIITSLFDFSLNLPPSSNQLSRHTTCYNFSIDASGNDIICPITMEYFHNEDAVMRINRCGHIFKESALRTWFDRNTRCPVCRGTLAPPE